MNAATTTYTTDLNARESRGGASLARRAGALAARIVAALTLLLALAVALGPTRAHAFDLALNNVSGAKGVDFSLMFRSTGAEENLEEAPRRYAEVQTRSEAGKANTERNAPAD